MDIKSLSDDFCVTGMISIDDLKQAKADGFQSVICHRCEGEAEDFSRAQPLKEAAEALGLVFHFAPVKPMSYGEEDVAAYEKALSTLPKPVLSFCRTGTRAAHMWLKAKQKEGKEALEEAKCCAKAQGIGNVDEVCC